MELTDEEVRVLGCLVEKELTTPQQYPLTLNALVLACNQSSNRDPVCSYDEATVEAAVTSAKTRGLARFVHPSHGRSVIRYRHELGEQLALGERPLALLAVLMLRGPQTPGELRARTERMTEFADLGELEAELGALVAREEPLVARLPRAPGQKEVRYAHLLAGPAPAGGTVPAAAAAAVPATVHAAPTVGGSGPASAATAGAGAGAVAELREQVARMRVELDELRAEMGRLRDELGG
jgi:uncharacterized protein YceH (UPF0502 family)